MKMTIPIALTIKMIQMIGPPLEAGRKDIARLLRELAAMQYRPLPAEATGEAPAATRLQNAA